MLLKTCCCYDDESYPPSWSNPLWWHSVQLHNLDQRQKVSKGEVLTLGGGGPGEVVVTYVCPGQSVTLTGTVSRIPTHSFPLSRLNVFWPRQTFALRANSGVLCPRAESEADFYSPPVTPGQRVPPP